MNVDDNGNPPRYILVDGDRFEEDRNRAAFGANSFFDPARAERWEEGLERALQALTSFPGPLSHARDEEASAFYGCEVRRLLYHGPGHRRSKQPVRILFTLFPPAEDDPDGETVISLLRLLHGGRSLHTSDDPDAASS